MKNSSYQVFDVENLSNGAICRSKLNIGKPVRYMLHVDGTFDANTYLSVSMTPLQGFIGLSSGYEVTGSVISSAGQFVCDFPAGLLSFELVTVSGESASANVHLFKLA
jgi:hypothetical protein